MGDVVTITATSKNLYLVQWHWLETNLSFPMNLTGTTAQHRLTFTYNSEA
jgi:hypothetical protein